MAARASGGAIEAVKSLGFPWQTRDPFLFCVYHDDLFPAGNDDLGPKASLRGRNLGQDFGNKDWNMYHGETVPGFPKHPHRGFETVTVVRHGLIDHCDSLGAKGRFGGGDVQWMTAGRGISHSEMFPLLKQDDNNRLELFQIWMNLPSKRKMAEPYFTMLWSETIPKMDQPDANGRITTVATVSGRLQGAGDPPEPPPNSWAVEPNADVCIWTIRMDAQGTYTIPAAPVGVNRNVYFFKGTRMTIGGQNFTSHSCLEVKPDVDLELVNTGNIEAELLMLQGRPIAEPIAQHGPFVMNTRQEIMQAFQDYQRTEFGGWPHNDDAPVHDRSLGRFAHYPDGHDEFPESCAPGKGSGAADAQDKT